VRSPPYSPDLNPIEWMWADLKRYVRRRRCSTEDELVEAINGFQRQLTPKKCQKLINKLREVIRTVILKKVGWSNY